MARCEVRIGGNLPSGIRYLGLESRCSIGDETLILTAVTDISAHKDLEEKLREAKNNAEEAVRSKNEFLANMSHEIRTPMNAVMGMLQLLQRESLNEEQKDFVDTAKQGADSLLTVINDILDLSKIEAGRLQLDIRPFDVRKLADGVVKLFAKQAQDKGLQLTAHTDDTVPQRLEGDEVRIRQILFNLVGNAVKFTHQGQVELKVENLGDRKDDSLQIVFAVSDTGVGIPKRLNRIVFGPFVQGDQSFSKRFAGTGLGLAIVKRLVEMMSGDVTLKSARGQGTDIRIVLPLRRVADETSAPEKSERSEIDAAKRPLRILLAEDNALNSKFMTALLSDIGHSVEVAENGEEVLAALEDKGVFDIVLMDVQMPVMDGVETSRRIRSGKCDCPSDIPIIALTAYAQDRERKVFLDAGMDDHVSKPVMLGDLEQRMQRLVKSAVDA